MTLWQRIKSWFGGKKKPKAESLAITDHRASFLFDNGGTRVMNILSYQINDEQAMAVVDRSKLNGDTVIYAYIGYNKGDGGGITSIYKNDIFGGTIDEDKKALIIRRLKAIRAKKMFVVGWFFPDDNGNRIPYNDDKMIAGYIQNTIGIVDPYISEYVIGLEANEYFKTAARIKFAADTIKLFTNKKLGLHLTPHKYDLSAYWKIDRHYHQYDWVHTPAEMENETASIKKALGKSVIAAEYSLNSDSDEAKAAGVAAMRGGADGTGCGR